MTLTREDLVAKSKAKPLNKLGWQDIRGTMRDFAEANVVIVKDGEKARIMKDRRGQYLHLKKDADGLVMVDELKPAFAA